ncbi:MAG: ATP-binding protein [Myxococcales bacterium]
MEHDSRMEREASPGGVEEQSQERLSETTPIVDVAAAVAHEVANAVAAIAGWADLGLAGGSDPFQALSLIASCARTAEQAARRMLRLARGDIPDDDLGVLDVSQLTTELVQLLSITARQARVDLVTAIEPGLNLVGARGHWFSLLWNLVKNAIEASPPNTTVSVTLSGDDVGMELEITDQGPGLDDVAQARIFTPYVTTKENGTGIGLHLVREAVEALGGHLLLRSRVGQGATFRVRLPRAARNSEVVGAIPLLEGPAPGDTSGSDAAPRGSQILDVTLLVVDDDDALREMMATALSLRGAKVVTARNAEEARTHAGPFDVALIDMTLGDIRGDELLAQLRRRGSVHAAMLVTGTAQAPRLVPGGEPDDWVRKPFEVSDLVDRLKRTLERHRMLQAATASRRR